MTTRLPRTINDLGAGATTVAELVGPLPTGYVSSSSDDEGMPIDARAADDPFGMLDYDADIPESASATTTTTTWARELGSLGLKDHGEDILLSGEAPPTTPDPIRNDNASTLSLDALEANGIARPAATPRVCSFPGCECDKSAKIDWRQPMLCNHWFCKNTVARARKLGACPFHGCGRPAKPIQTQTKKGSDQEGSATATTSPSQSSVKPKPNPSDAVASALGLKRKSGAGDETEIPKRQRKQAAPIPAPTTVETTKRHRLAAGKYGCASQESHASTLSASYSRRNGRRYHYSGNCTHRDSGSSCCSCSRHNTDTSSDAFDGRTDQIGGHSRRSRHQEWNVSYLQDAFAWSFRHPRPYDGSSPLPRTNGSRLAFFPQGAFFAAMHPHG